MIWGTTSTTFPVTQTKPFEHTQTGYIQQYAPRTSIKIWKISITSVDELIGGLRQKAKINSFAVQHVVTAKQKLLLVLNENKSSGPWG